LQSEEKENARQLHHCAVSEPVPCVCGGDDEQGRIIVIGLAAAAPHNAMADGVMEGHHSLWKL